MFIVWFADENEDRLPFSGTIEEFEKMLSISEVSNFLLFAVELVAKNAGSLFKVPPAISLGLSFLRIAKMSSC